MPAVRSVSAVVPMPTARVVAVSAIKAENAARSLLAKTSHKMVMRRMWTVVVQTVILVQLVMTGFKMEMRPVWIVGVVAILVQPAMTGFKMEMKQA